MRWKHIGISIWNVKGTPLGGVTKTLGPRVLEMPTKHLSKYAESKLAMFCCIEMDTAWITLQYLPSILIPGANDSSIA